MKKGRIWAILGIIVFAFLLYKLDFRASMARLSQMNMAWFAAAVGILGLNQYLGYAKWKVMYQSTVREEERSQHLLPIYTSSLVLGMVTPAHSGDLLAAMAWKKMQGKVLAWAIFHRVSEGVTTIVISLVVLASFFRHVLSGTGWLFACVGVVVLLAAIALILNPATGRWMFHFFRAVLGKMRRFPFARTILVKEEKIKEQMEHFYHTLKQFNRRHTLGFLIFLTLINRVVIVYLNICILASLGVSLPVIHLLGVLAASWAGGFLSVTPNGIGTGDLAPALVMSGLGFQEYAGSYIVVNRLLELSIILFWPTLLFFFSKRKVLQGS